MKKASPSCFALPVGATYPNPSPKTHPRKAPFYQCVGAALGWGSPDRGAEKGPGVLRALWEDQWRITPGDNVGDALPANGPHHPEMAWPYMLYSDHSFEKLEMPLGEPSVWLIEKMCADLAQTVAQIVAAERFPVVVGGDHAMAVGTWSGLIAQRRALGRFGLLWIDAHMDAHTPETTPSEAYHGMPLAALLGHGKASLVNLRQEGAKVDPRHVCLLGVRSFEEGEQALLQRLGVRIFDRKEIRLRGFSACLAEAVARASQAPEGFGVSFDLDVFDPEHAPGVGTPEPDGLNPSEVLPALNLFTQHPAFYGFELVEYNPLRDRQGQTARLAGALLNQVVFQHHQTFACPENKSFMTEKLDKIKA